MKRSNERIKVRKKAFGNPEPRNVILFVMDSVPEHQFRNAMPVYMTKLANSFRGFYYDDAWSPSNWTLPGLTSLVCGRLPHSDGSEQVLPPDYEMIDNLNKTGYNTYLFTSMGLINFWPYKDKFKVYEQFFDADSSKPEQGADKIVKAVNKIKEPYFAVFHMAETHYWFETPDFKMPDNKKIGLGRFYPRTAPGKKRINYLLEKQRDAIRYLDEILEKIHKKLEGTNPVTIVTADHGTVLRDDFTRYFHAWGFHKDMYNVPLLIHNISISRRLNFKEVPK